MNKNKNQKNSLITGELTDIVHKFGKKFPRVLNEPQDNVSTVSTRLAFLSLL